MVDADKQALLAGINAFRHTLGGQSPSEALDRVRYQSERLELALRNSHAEAIRFAAYTINHALNAKADAFDPPVRATFAELKRALEAAGHHF